MIEKKQKDDFFDTKYGLNLSVLDLEEKPNQPDYSECIVNLSNSILKHYGIPTDNASLPVADSILSKNKKHVVVVLLDGLGVNILQEHLHYKDFLRRNFICTYSSVFPPTTTASTTSFLSGKYPIEHGWLGWDLHFEQENKTVTCFKNVLQDSETPASTEYNIPFKYLPYESIIEKINKSGNAKAYQVATFGDEPCTQLDDWIKKIQNYCHKDERNFIYAYWNEPDHALHHYGTKSKEVHDIIQELNIKMMDLCETCPDTTFILTADHGHLDISNQELCTDFPELSKMLVRQPSIEPRAISFYVKPEYLEEFPKKFVKEFGTDYVLFTKQEVLEKNMFGLGNPHSNLTGIGDFVAAAFTPKTLVWNEKSTKFRSHHAGLTKKELEIPLISFEYKKNREGLIVYYGIVAMIVIFFIMIMI